MKQVVFVAAEVHPFAQTGGLAEVIGSLPQAIKETSRDYQVSVVMPYYRVVQKKIRDQVKLIATAEVMLAWRRLYCGFLHLNEGGIDYYFIDNQYYYDRDELYGHYDDGERFAFFGKAVFHLLDAIHLTPDILHTHDWHSAMVNVYLDILYKKEGHLLNTKSIFTIHNIQYQGIFPPEILEDVLGISSQYRHIMEYNGLVNFMKGAITTADLVTTVSPRYAKEIRTAQFACGLEYITRLHPEKIEGILNGINTVFYDPNHDPILSSLYTPKTFHQKAINKEYLQKSLGLVQDTTIPMIAIISRLVTQKGLNLVVDVFRDMMELPCQIIILGKGDDYYQEKFVELAKEYPGRVASIIAFDINLSKKIYAGSDIFLMPSKMEPCGLSQMIACRYGTVPIVRATGGLFDSIKDVSDTEEKGNGFVFKDFDAGQMLEKVKEAIALYQEPPQFKKLAKHIMSVDFSWNVSAKRYIEKYNQLLNH
ncbi:MAG: glycogen/starch synthase [Bacilli bacterium]|nr:glycogen/starch synthase [Bacilli bacterium]